MLELFRRVTLRHLYLEPLRSALMIFGIALGVAVFVGVQALNETTIRGFEAMFKAAGEKADLLVEGGHNGLDQALVADLRKRKEVRAAAPIMTNYARPVAATASSLSVRRYLILGLDLLDDSTASLYGLAKSGNQTTTLNAIKSGQQGVYLPNPEQLMLNPACVIITADLAVRENKSVGDQISFFTAQGRRDFVVAGVFRSQTLTDTLGSDVMIMFLKGAQIMFSRQGKVDRISVKLKPGESIEAAQKSLQKHFGRGISIRPPTQGSLRASDMLGSMQLGLTLASFLALLIGQFLIYNTMSTAIVRRRPEIGILRAIGSTKKQLAWLWFGEAAAYGFLGALLGIVIGLGVAQAALGVFANSVSQLYEAIDLRVLHFSWQTLILGLFSGPVATLIAAVLPVREALKIQPVEAARRDIPGLNSTSLIRNLALLGLVILICTQGFVLVWDAGIGLFVGSMLQFLLTMGFALAAPWGVATVTTLVRPSLSRILGPAGALAGDNLVKNPIRSGITVASLMVALGGVLSIASLVVSLQTCVSSWLDGVLTGDLYISASAPLGSQSSTPMERSFEKVLQDRFGESIAVVQPLRFVFEQVDDRSTLLIACKMDVFGARSSVPVTAGSMAEARPQLVAGTGVIVSENFCSKRGKKLGDTIHIATARGSRSFKISLVVVDYSSEHGTLFINRSTFDEEFEDTRVNTFNIYLKPDVTAERRQTIAEAIRSDYGPKYDLFVLNNETFRARILTTIEDSFQVSYAMEVVAIGIALLGVINTLFAAVLERTRILGVLRALGASKRQIRKAVVSEALLLGALSGVFGIVCGLVLGYVLVTDITAGAFGWRIPYSAPWLPAIVGAVLTAFFSAFAGLLPAEHAANIDIVDALNYE